MMARLRKEDPEEDSDPVRSPVRRRRLPTNQDNAAATKARPTRSGTRRTYSTSEDSSAEDSDTGISLVPKSKITTKKTQVWLAPKASTNDGVLGFRDLSAATRQNRTLYANPAQKNRITERLSPAKCEPLRLKTKPKSLGKSGADSDIDEVDVEESIWCGSTNESEKFSEEELPSLKKIANPQRQPDLTKHLQALSIFDDEIKDSRSQPRSSVPQKVVIPKIKPGSSSDKENGKAILHYSPPRSKSPQKGDPLSRPNTPPPPTSPSKSKLKSPSKRRVRIPTPPLRPSLDAFWTAETVNDWNDQYSPQKPLKSPRKLFSQPESEDTTPLTSPAKIRSPTKRTKSELEARKAFEAGKMALAESFLQELDQTITNGQIQKLAESTGGVRIVWSKTLNSTAGRANWRRETTKSRSTNPDSKVAPIVTHKHFAFIELATKVIDDEHRLLNVIAHEFCHLANFMVSEIKDQPHGKSFKEWGRRCTKAFGARGVEVTTKHSYEIEYKYIWQCESDECGMEFKRHSKSIDPARHRCGGCKKGLVQIKPVPRKVATTPVMGDGKERAPPPVTGYAAFVKEHFASLKKTMAGASHKEVMEALGKKYRAEKASSLDAIAGTLGNLKLNDPVVVIDSD